MAHAERSEHAREPAALFSGGESEPRPQLGAPCVHSELPTGLGIDEPELAGVGQLLLPWILDLHRDHVVAARELEQGLPPVEWATKVGDDGDERRLARERCRARRGLAQRGLAHPTNRRRLVAQGAEETDQPGAALPWRERPWPRVAEGDQPEAIPTAGRKVADRNRDSLGDVRLAPVRRPELHRG